MSTTSLHQRFSCRENDPRLLKIVTTTGLLNRHVDFFMLLRSESITTLAHDLIPVTHCSTYPCIYVCVQKNFICTIENKKTALNQYKLVNWECVLWDSCCHHAFTFRSITTQWRDSCLLWLSWHVTAGKAQVSSILLILAAITVCDGSLARLTDTSVKQSHR